LESLQIKKIMKAIATKKTISQNRAKVEAAMSADPEQTWTVSKVRKEICNVPHAANYLNGMREAGLTRIIGTNQSGHNVYVWHTSSRRNIVEKPDGIAGPRIYVNGSMPNADAQYWKRAMSWGR
jgi:hypothetical protein